MRRDLDRADRCRRFGLGRRRGGKLHRRGIVERTGGLWLAEQEALQLAVAGCFEKRILFVGLNALDRYRQVELTRKHEHRADDRDRTAVIGQVVSEDAVDLEP